MRMTNYIFMSRAKLEDSKKKLTAHKEQLCSRDFNTDKEI